MGVFGYGGEYTGLANAKGGVPGSFQDVKKPRLSIAALFWRCWRLVWPMYQVKDDAQEGDNHEHCSPLAYSRALRYVENFNHFPRCFMVANWRSLGSTK